MPLEVQQLNCPNCGGALNINNPGRSKTLVCQWCGTQIDLTQPPYQAKGLVGNRPEPIGTQFRLGMQGAIGGVTYQIIGRIRYVDNGEISDDGSAGAGGDEGADIWDEWLILSAEGAYRWISDSQDVGLVLWEPFVPLAPVEPATINRGATVDLGNGMSARVRSRGSAALRYIEGELTWRATVGSRMDYAEAVSKQGLISIEWTENEVEFFRGQHLDRTEIENAFGIEHQVRTMASGSATKMAPRTLLILVVVGIIVLCLCASMFSSGGGGFYGGVSSGSPGRSYGSSGGGGSRGGGGK